MEIQLAHTLVLNGAIQKLDRRLASMQRSVPEVEASTQQESRMTAPTSIIALAQETNIALSHSPLPTGHTR